MGGSVSQLSPEELEKLKNGTPFDDQDLQRILNRYAEYDSSEKGTSGIDIDALMTIPELRLHPLKVRLLHLVADIKTNRVHPMGFVKLFGILSSKTDVAIKKKVAFQCFDTNNTGCLRYEELFHMFKLMLDYAVDDDQLTRIVYSALKHPSLQTPDQIVFTDFVRIVHDLDIRSKFTVDL